MNNFSDPLVTVYDKSVVGKVERLSNHTKYALDGDKMLTMACQDNNVLLVGKDGMSRLFDGNDNKVVKTVATSELYDKTADGVYTCMSRDKKGVITDEPSNLVITGQDGNVAAHFNTQFNGAFYNDGMLTVVMKSGIFSTRM